MKKLFNILTISTLLFVFNSVQAERIKDLASVTGVRDNQLVGYGLVVGLQGSGDQVSQTPFTLQSIKSMLSQFGVQIPAGVSFQTKNVAAVVLHAKLPPFIKVGQKVDVTISSLGNAKSLRGGTLLMAPLKGADGKVYAIAQGDLVVSGLTASGKDGSNVTVNHPNVGRIPNGATVERSVRNSFASSKILTLNLFNADFTTVNRMVIAINDVLGEGTAKALDSVSVSVTAPVNASQKVAFLSVLESIKVNPDDASAKVIVNSRTGTVVISRTVRITPAAISHGSMTVTVTESPQVSQPNPGAQGETQVQENSAIGVNEETNRMFVFDAGITLQDLVQAVNDVGASPSDLVAILDALRVAGALKAELIII
ncbi:MAG: flagellar basal body P-ring protein FlgI [Methylococcales bacterium]|nr:flagellar basal body P-ring protein FlgI [Methylococcales bacterium]MBT7409723.1 flagellar basal body P-ring protein FlgI [Methylococcales bacterium]